MWNQPEIRYVPVVEPTDPASLPTRLARGRAVLAPLALDRRRRPRGARWLHRLARDRPLWGHFCISDASLRRFERFDPLGLATARRAGAHGIVSMDTPLYGFMTPPQRRRSEAFHAHRLHRTLDRAHTFGLDVVPLVKALDADTLRRQLDDLRDLGLHTAALYARELLLERDPFLLRRFIRAAHSRRIAPVLIGAVSRSLLDWGPAHLAGRHHYVLARRGVLLGSRGERIPLDAARYSRLAGRFLVPGDVGALTAHNFEAARLRLEAPAAARAFAG